MTSDIVRISAIEDPGEVFGLRIVDQALIDVGLAEIAARGIVAAVAGIFCFPAMNQLVGDSDLGRNIPSGLKVALGQTRGDGGNGHRVGTELLMGDSQDETAIDPSREGDEDTLEISDDF